jgi:hypothetical protein
MWFAFYHVVFTGLLCSLTELEVLVVSPKSFGWMELNSRPKPEAVAAVLRKPKPTVKYQFLHDF